MAKPLWILGGLAAGAAALVMGARKAKAAEGGDMGADTSLPIAERPGYGQAKAQHDHAMQPDVRDLAYLAQVASWLEERGFPELAAPVRNKWELERLTGAAAPRPEDRPGYGQAKAYYDHAMANIVDPAVLASWASTLTAQGFPEMGQGLASKAASYTPSGAASYMPAETPVTTSTTTSASYPTTTPAPVPASPATPPVEYESGAGVDLEPVDDDDEPAMMPPPAAIPPVAREETAPDLDPHGTVLLARALLAREGSSGWKEALQGEVKAWQGRVGLTADGKMGPGGLERMAREVGVLPLVRFWPLGEWRKEVAVDSYRFRIERVASEVEVANPAHAAALRASAAREKGQGWPSAPAPITATEASTLAAQVAAAISGGSTYA
ncbi:MAG: hypothetical protein WC372_09825 [Candidatus Neomarinimicrobiota bacterium]|jgi:hypothetical protein